MYRTCNTPHGTFNSPTDYKHRLDLLGYISLGWQNEWRPDGGKEKIWKSLNEEGLKTEFFQWNDTGSHCTYVIHEREIFCSVDMGD